MENGCWLLTFQLGSMLPRFGYERLVLQRIKVDLDVRERSFESGLCQRNRGRQIRFHIRIRDRLQLGGNLGYLDDFFGDAKGNAGRLLESSADRGVAFVTVA